MAIIRLLFVDQELIWAQKIDDIYKNMITRKLLP